MSKSRPTSSRSSTKVVESWSTRRWSNPVDREDKYAYIDAVLNDELTELENGRYNASFEEPWTERIGRVNKAIKLLRELGGWSG